MRGRRHKLAVSTFPFLAVLLCAMGSLILILLVMDRKAHQAVLARSQREAARLAEESAHDETARRAELEQKRQLARAAWEQKRDALHANLSREQIELQMQMRKVRDQLSEIAARLRYEQDTGTQLRHKVNEQRERLGTEKQILDTLRTTAEQSATQSKESSKSLQRMTADLLQMEQALKDLKAARQREQHTFSVVPYHGRRGESRRPIYVECNADAVIFHPERRVMPVTSRQFLLGHDVPGSTPDDVRAEVERRIARLRAKTAGVAGASNATPYLLLLVRPDGVSTYCQFQAVLKDMTLDFGYEFIDADWVLDFPADDEQPNAQPWMTAAQGSTSPPAASAVPSASGARARSIGLSPQQAAIASSGAVVQGIRTGESSGPMDVSRGASFQAATGGTGPGGSGPSLPGAGPGGSGTSVPGGVRYLSSNGGVPGSAAGGNASNGLPGLVVGPVSNRPGQPGGAASNLYGQPGGSGTAVASSSSDGGDGSLSGGGGSGSIRGFGVGRGHPAALAPSGVSDDGGLGTAGGETPGGNNGEPGGYVLRGSGRGYFPGSPTNGAPGASNSDSLGLGPPRALSSGVAGNALAANGMQGYVGNGVPGNGYPGNGTTGNGTTGNRYLSNGGTGNGGTGNGAPGNAAPGNGVQGNGVPGNGVPGNGVPGNGVPGNGGTGNGAPGNGGTGNGAPGNGGTGNGGTGNGGTGNGGTGNDAPGSGGTGNGAPGNGVPGNGAPGNGVPGNGAPGNGVPGNGVPGNGAPGSGAPGSGAPGNGTPGSGMPGKRYPGNGASGNGVPGNGVPGNGAPGNGAPGNGTPGNGAPGNGTPGNGTPGNGTPGNGVPGNGTPTNGVPGAGGTSLANSGQASPGAPGTMSGSSGNDGRTSQSGSGPAFFAAIDPLAPQRPPGAVQVARGPDAQPDQPPADSSPDDVPPRNPPRRILAPAGGGSGGQGDAGSAALNRFAPPVTAPPPRRPAPAGLRPAWVHGGRDWTIFVECRPDTVVLYPSEKQFTLAQAASDAAFNPLAAAIEQMIDRRQSTRRPGEPPYYPKVCLLVRPENLRSFLTVYPALEALPVPKTRQNLDPDDDVSAIVRGANP